MHTYRGPNGLIINHNGDFSGMAILRYQEMEIEVPASEIAPYVEQERIVREIAASDPWMSVGDETHKCGHCGLWRIWSNKKKRWEYDAARGATKDVAEQHLPDCRWLRSRAIVARLEGSKG